MTGTRQVLAYDYVETPVGPFLLAGSDGEVELASFAPGPQRREPQPGWRRDSREMAFAGDQVREYFAGERDRFELQLRLGGTPFQQQVWRALVQIPRGDHRSYGEVAAAIGRPGAARAVGAANRANVIPLIIPCHRVVGADGSLTGFGGGMETKRWLLEFEGSGSLPSNDANR